MKDASIEDFTFHDFRHTAKTRWAKQGLPMEVSDVASGHKIPGIRGRYINLRDQDILEAFASVTRTCQNEKAGDTTQASNSMK